MPRAVIIGAGIGGLTAGIALKQTGWEMAVFERAPVLSEVGAGITLWTNAVKVLQKLDVWKSMEEDASVIGSSEVRTWWGKVLMEMDFGSLNKKLGAPTIGIHRADLQSKLADALGREHIHLGATCVGYSQDATSATAKFADGREERGDLLIGADGIKSAIRAQMLGDEPLRYAGYTAWRGVGLIDRPEVPLGVTLLAMGRGSQVGILPIGRGRTYWFATANVPAGESDPPGGHKPPLLKRFGDWWPAIPAALEATPESGIIRNDIFDRKPVRKWSDGRVTLLGDAAHPTTPNMGQGACQAIESGFVLSKCLKSIAEVPSALLAYQDARFDRTAMITNRSWSFGKIFAYENRLKCWARNAFFRLFGDLSVKSTEKLIGYEA